MSDLKKIICIDFDGVVHSYTSGWKGADVVSDPPVPGMFEWLADLVAAEDLEPVIYSSRSGQDGGTEAMRAWFIQHGLPPDVLGGIAFSAKKPAAFLTIDDRAICFEGSPPGLNAIRNFRPWNKR